MHATIPSHFEGKRVFKPAKQLRRRELKPRPMLDYIESLARQRILDARSTRLVWRAPEKISQ
jgi:hypothetical protein